MTSATAANRCVLLIDNRVPQFDKNAGDATIYQYLRVLIGGGVKVVYKPYDQVRSQPYTRHLQQLGVEFQFENSEFEAWMNDRKGRIHTVLLARPDVASAYLPSIRRLEPSRVVYYVHDLHHVREQRRFASTADPVARTESERLRALEGSIFRQVDSVITPSDAEAPMISQLAPNTRVDVVPAYVSKPSLGGAETRREKLIFVGGFGHSPNVDAARHLVGEVMPLVWSAEPEAQLMLVGSDPTADVLRLAGDRVTVTGFVPELAPYFAQSRASINPIRFGAGVKGKIVSSLEAGVPVVTTSMGAEGLNLVSGENALIADDPGDIAAAAVRLLRDDSLVESLASAGRAFCRAEFGEERVRAALLTALGLA